MYYDETNSHPLDASVFFADVPSSTQPMELGGVKCFFFLFFFNTSVLTKKMPYDENDNNLLMRVMITLFLNASLKMLITLRGSTSFNLAIQREDHFIIQTPLPHYHLGDDGITNISSDILIES